MGIRGSLKVLGWEVAQRELNVLLFVHLHSLIFQRYTKQSLKRNSMKWTMHMCLLQPQLMGTWYKKKKKKHKMQDFVTLPATDQNCCVLFFLSAKAGLVFIKVLFSSLVKYWGCADVRNEPQSKICLWNFWSYTALTMFDLVDFRFSLHYLFVWQFGDLGHDNKDNVQGSVLLFVL